MNYGYILTSFLQRENLLKAKCSTDLRLQAMTTTPVNHSHYREESLYTYLELRLLDSDPKLVKLATPCKCEGPRSIAYSIANCRGGGEKISRRNLGCGILAPEL